MLTRFLLSTHLAFTLLDEIIQILFPDVVPRGSVPVV